MLQNIRTCLILVLIIKAVVKCDATFTNEPINNSEVYPFTGESTRTRARVTGVRDRHETDTVNDGDDETNAFTEKRVRINTSKVPDESYDTNIDEEANKQITQNDNTDSRIAKSDPDLDIVRSNRFSDESDMRTNFAKEIELDSEKGPLNGLRTELPKTIEPDFDKDRTRAIRDENHTNAKISKSIAPVLIQSTSTSAKEAKSNEDDETTSSTRESTPASSETSGEETEFTTTEVPVPSGGHSDVIDHASSTVVDQIQADVNNLTSDDASRSHSNQPQQGSVSESTPSTEVNEYQEGSDETTTVSEQPSKAVESTQAAIQPDDQDADVTEQPASSVFDQHSSVAELASNEDTTSGSEADDPGRRKPKTEDTETASDNKMNRPKISVSKDSKLRTWLNNPWLRSPSAVLVPLRVTSLTRARDIWQEVVKGSLSISDIWLVGYDIHGIGWVSKHNTSSDRAMGTNTLTATIDKLIQKYQESPPQENSDAVMQACSRASKLVPYDSALYIITDTEPSDSINLQQVTRTLLAKRLKAYVVWTNPNQVKFDSELVLDLRRLTQYTMGEFMTYSLSTQSTLGEVNEDLEYRRLMTKHIQPISEYIMIESVTKQESQYTINVDEELSSLFFELGGLTNEVTLKLPTGKEVDLMDQSSVQFFQAGSTILTDAPLKVYLKLPTRLSMVKGAWSLTIVCDICDFTVKVGAITKTGVDAIIINNNLIRMRFHGAIASVSDASLIDGDGGLIVKLPYKQEITGDSMVTDIPLPEMEPITMHVKVNGKTIRGDSYIRISKPVYRSRRVVKRSATFRFPDEMAGDMELVDLNVGKSERALLYNTNDTTSLNNAYSSQIANQQGNLLASVQIGLGTKIYGTPGDTLQLHFEVSNYRERNILYTFEATGNLKFLRGIRPSSKWLSPGETASVLVDVGITASAQVGARDLITFTARGLEPISISSYVYVITSVPVTATDFRMPELRNDIQGDCIGKMGSDCDLYTWTANIIARDTDSGLLRVSTSPVGFLYETSFTAGVRDQVKGSFRSTCCNRRAVVTAIDFNGNSNSYLIDVTYYLPPAMIAAICLGVLLLIALIALIALGVYLCVRSRKDSRSLPTFISSTRRDVS